MAVRLGGSTLQAAMKTHESQCRWCKEVFLHTEDHAYKGCCTWSCLCKFRESEANQKKMRGTKTIIRTEAQALARIEECKAKIAHYEAMNDNEMVNPRTKKSVRGTIWEWKCKLNDARRTLRIIKGEEDDEECDDRAAGS